jgi:hypothetical protein
MKAAVRTYETLVYFNETTQRYIPGSYYLHIRHRENLKFHICNVSPKRFINEESRSKAIRAE